MKYKSLTFLTLAVFMLFGVAGSSAQEIKKDDKKTQKEMKMSEMNENPHHAMMLPYQQNMVNFAKALRGLAKEARTWDADFARTAVAEIKRSAERIDEIHRKHMDTKSAEMREKMKPMMEEMKKEQAELNEQILALEKAVESNTLNAKEIEIRTAAIISELEKEMAEQKRRCGQTKRRNNDLRYFSRALQIVRPVIKILPVNM